MSVAVDSAIDTVAAAAAAYTVPRVVALLDEKTCVGAAVTECVLDIGVEDERVWAGDDALVDDSHPCRDRAVVKRTDKSECIGTRPATLSTIRTTSARTGRGGIESRHGIRRLRS